jgi:hypothetical protein
VSPGVQTERGVGVARPQEIECHYCTTVLNGWTRPIFQNSISASGYNMANPEESFNDKLGELSLSTHCRMRQFSAAAGLERADEIGALVVAQHGCSPRPMYDIETWHQAADMVRSERPLIRFRIDQLGCSDHVHDLEWQFHSYGLFDDHR